MTKIVRIPGRVIGMTSNAVRTRLSRGVTWAGGVVNWVHGQVSRWLAQVDQELSRWPKVKALWDRHRQPALAFSGVLFGVALWGGFILRPQYSASATIVVGQKDIKSEWDLLIDETRDVDFEEQVLSRAVLEPSLRQLGLFPPKPKAFPGFKPRPLSPKAEVRLLVSAVQRFRTRFDVERLHHSGVLQITARARTPALAADMANTVAEFFIAYRRNEWRKREMQELAGLDETLLETGEQLERHTAEYNALLKENGWDTYLSELRMAQNRVTALKADIQKIEMILQAGPVALSLFPTPFTQPLTPEGERSSAGEDSLKDLMNQVVLANVRYDQARSRYLAGSPSVVQTQLQKEALERVLMGRLQERRQALERLLEGEQGRLQRLTIQAPKIQLLEGAIERARLHYQELLARRDKVQFALVLLKRPSSSSFQEMTILDRALPAAPLSPWRWLLWTCFKALMIGAVGLVLTPLLLHYWISKRGEGGSFSSENPLATWPGAGTSPPPARPRPAAVAVRMKADSEFQERLESSPENGDPNYPTAASA